MPKICRNDPVHVVRARNTKTVVYLKLWNNCRKVSIREMLIEYSQIMVLRVQARRLLNMLSH